MKPEILKKLVQEKYGAIASQGDMVEDKSCCGDKGCCDGMDYTIFSDDYSKLSGYNPDADLGLGCGLPTEYAAICEGDHLLDLGSGAGNDCFVARSFTGESGKVTGLDFTREMIQKASENLKQRGFSNIEFILGDIEDMPLPGDNFDVVISNCVLNLVPDKRRAFSEIYRVLKPGGHFCISDVVLCGNLPSKIREAAEMYAGCVSGAVQMDEYIEIIQNQGFTDIEIKKCKKIIIPDSILLKYIQPGELETFSSGETGILSITVTANK